MQLIAFTDCSPFFVVFNVWLCNNCSGSARCELNGQRNPSEFSGSHNKQRNLSSVAPLPRQSAAKGVGWSKVSFTIGVLRGFSLRVPTQNSQLLARLFQKLGLLTIHATFSWLQFDFDWTYYLANCTTMSPMSPRRGGQLSPALLSPFTPLRLIWGSLAIFALAILVLACLSSSPVEHQVSAAPMQMIVCVFFFFITSSCS